MDFEKIRIKPVWPKSKEEIWSEKFEPLVTQSESKMTHKKSQEEDSGNNFKIYPKPIPSWYNFAFLMEENRMRKEAKQIPFKKTNAARVEAQSAKKRFPLWGYAASILIPVLLFCSLYTVTETTKRGEQAVVQLPDRSTVTLNAESKLSYKPFIWFISRKGASSSNVFARKVSLEGEAYFEVTPGNRFSVQTGDYRVNVLGTTFNVQARPGMYRVTCLTGQVEVQTGQETAPLGPNMQASLHERKLTVIDDVTPSVAIGWMKNMFVFEGTPLGEVIAEIERQYNITVIPDYDPNHLYSGFFSKTENPTEILEAIGKAFGITFSIHNVKK